MTLAPVQLDNLTWDQMVQAIRRRIPAESSGNWTLHAPVDPGITFLDLFAFLAEQRLYWLDQVPDAFVVAVLRLLGQDDPLPPAPAATVLQITAVGQSNPVPGRRPGSPGTRPVRSCSLSTTDVTVLPVGSLTLQTDGQDGMADLRAGREVDLFPVTGGPGEARITLSLSPPVPSGWLSLLFDLDIPDVPPSWAAEAARRAAARPAHLGLLRRHRPGTRRNPASRSGRAGWHPGTAPLRHRSATRRGLLEIRYGDSCC